MELVATRSKRIEVSGSGVNIIFPPADEDYDRNRKFIDDACLMVVKETGAYDLFYSINRYCYGLRSLINDLKINFDSERSLLRIELQYHSTSPLDILTFYKVLFKHKKLLDLIVNEIGVKSVCMYGVIKTEAFDDVAKHFEKCVSNWHGGSLNSRLIDNLGAVRSESADFGRDLLKKNDWTSFGEGNLDLLKRKTNKANYRIFVNGFPLFEKEVRKHFHEKYISSLKELNKVLGELYDLMSPHIAILRMS